MALSGSLSAVTAADASFTVAGAAAWLTVRNRTVTLSGVADISQGGTGNTSGTATVNANLTGPITSVGNATSVASQTGTGTTFVMDTSPSLVTPALGVATATSLTVSAQAPAAGLGAIIMASDTGLFESLNSLSSAASSFYYDPACTVDGKEARPALVLNNIGLVGSYTNTSTKTPIMNYVYTVAPTGDQAGVTSNTWFKGSLLSTGTHAISGMTFIDAVNFHGGTNTAGYVVCLSATFGATAAGTVTESVGVTSVFRATSSPTFGNVRYYSAGTDDTALTGHITGNFYGYFVGSDGTGKGGLNIAGPNSVTLDGNRAALYIDTMSGTPGGTDRAIESIATQASTFAGAIQIGASAASTQFSARQDASLGSFTDSGASAVGSVSVNQGALTAVGTNQALIGDISMTLSGSPAAFSQYGVQGFSAIPSGDSATHNAATQLYGGRFTGIYNGSGAGAVVIGSSSRAMKGGSGTLSIAEGLDGTVDLTGNTGNVTSIVAIGATLTLTAASGTPTYGTVRAFNIPRPTSTAGVIWTTTVGIDVGNMTPSAAITQTNAPIALRIQSQTGTGAWAIQTQGTDDLIDFASKISKYNNVTTAGWGVASIPGYGRVVAATNTGTASIATYTCGAADGSFEVSANCQVTTSTTHSFSLDVTYTDETNTARTMVLPINQLGGAFLANGLITNVTGVGPYESASVHIRVKASTAITIRTSAGGTFTTVVYNAEGVIKQTA